MIKGKMPLTQWDGKEEGKELHINIKVKPVQLSKTIKTALNLRLTKNTQNPFFN